jgi:hypothetical protein
MTGRGHRLFWWAVDCACGAHVLHLTTAMQDGTATCPVCGAVHSRPALSQKVPGPETPKTPAEGGRQPPPAE